jgi:Tfp pilus assembly protein PilO
MSTENNDAVSTLSSNSREASPPTSVIAKYLVILIVASLLLLFFGVKPALEGYFGNNTKITQQLETNEANAKTFDELRAKQQNLSSTKVEVNEFLESFPSSASFQSMLAELNSIAAKNGVTIGSIAPSVGTPKAGGTASGAPASGGAAGAPSSDLVAPINIDMSLTGGNPNQFLADLEKSSRVFIINSLSYNENKDNKAMTIKATTYVVQPLVNPDVAVPEAANGGAVTPPADATPAEQVPAPAPAVEQPAVPAPAPAAPSSAP